MSYFFSLSFLNAVTVVFLNFNLPVLAACDICSRKTRVGWEQLSTEDQHCQELSHPWGRKEKIYIPPPPPHTRVSYSGSPAHPLLNGTLSGGNVKDGFSFLCNSEMMRNHRTTVNKIHCLPRALQWNGHPEEAPWGQALVWRSAPFSRAHPRPRHRVGLGWMFGGDGWMDSMPVFGGHEAHVSDGSQMGWISSVDEGGPSAVCPPAPGLIELIKIKQIVTLAWKIGTAWNILKWFIFQQSGLVWKTNLREASWATKLKTGSFLARPGHFHIETSESCRK